MRLFRVFIIGCSVFLINSNAQDELLKGVDLSTVNMVELKTRMKSPSLVFTPKDVAIYLAKTPDERKAVEKKRISLLKSFKAMVQKLINRRAYSGNIYIGSVTYSGKINKAEDDGLLVEVTGKGEKKVDWAKFHIRQYADIFIMEVMSKAEGIDAADKRQGAEDIFKKAANYYYVLALFYDWHEVGSVSQLYRKKALTLNPGMKEKLDELLPLAVQ